MNVAAGVFFYSKDTNRCLYLLRADSKATVWGIPGGGIDDTETLFEGIERECMEEMQCDVSNRKLIPIQKFTNNNFTYHTFYCEVDNEFIPVLNSEHTGYAWVNEDQYPKPLHPGVFSTVNLDVVREKLKSLKGKRLI